MLVGLQRAALAGRRPEEGAILDITQAIEEEVLDTPNPPPPVVDKAHDSQKVRQQISDEGALPVIPIRDNAITARSQIAEPSRMSRP
jgi:hypothetical protein